MELDPAGYAPLEPPKALHRIGEENYTRLDGFQSQLERSINPDITSKLDSEFSFPKGFIVNGRICNLVRGLREEILVIPRTRTEEEPYVCRTIDDFRAAILDLTGGNEVWGVRFFY